MVSQPPTDTPFGLEPNIAAGLAYLLGIIGGVIMLVGGGTNKFVKWAAAQSITLCIVYVVFWFALNIITITLHMFFLALLYPLIGLLFFIAWIWLVITGFQGKEVRLPLVGDLTQNIFRSMLA